MFKSDDETNINLVYAEGMSLAEKIGSMIRERRTSLPGGTILLKDLSEQTGIALSTLSAYERGARTPSLPAAVKIAKVLYLDLNVLVRDVEITDRTLPKNPQHQITTEEPTQTADSDNNAPMGINTKFCEV